MVNQRLNLAAPMVAKGLMRRAVPPSFNVEFMTAADRRTATRRPPKAEGRSPFVRLHELLADIKPGKPAINLSVGEPQHPIPPFVGPVLQAHLNDFGRYPANKGTERFRKAAAAWLGRRYQLARPVDPETEVIVLNGTREGLFLGAIAAKRYVPQRAGKPGDPDPQSVLRRLFGRRRRRRLRAGLSADARAKPASCPISMRSIDDAARAHRRLLSRLAVEPARRGRRRGLSDAPRRRWRGASAS